MLAKLREWAFDRATVGPETFQALNKGLPKGVGWLNTLGSTAMTLIAIQAITGIFLAMYYSPHPDAAYETMRYIDHELPMGRLVHGLHHYGASAVVIVVGLHMLRTYFHAAYKQPRELTWILGIVILQLVLAFGFTGYLLPWDQKAYWATEVGTKIPSGIPVFGPMIQSLMRGGQDIGAMTITRFYAIHVLLLPALLLPVVQAHLMLVWRKGPTPPGQPVGATVPKVSRFVDHQLFKDAVAMFAAFGLVFLLAVFRPVEMEFKANPTDPTYHPRPEWYFLFLFQFLNDFGKLPVIGSIPEWIPAVVIPGLGMAFLTLAPWIDRGPERKASRRPLMIGVMAVGLVGVIGLTVRAYAVLVPNATPGSSLYARFTDGGERELDTAQVLAGKQAFVQCGGCHAAYGDFTAGKLGPDLSGYGRSTFLAELKGHPDVRKLSFWERYERYVRGDLRPKDPQTGEEKTRMPKYPADALSQERLEAIGAYLSQDPKHPVREPAAPAAAE